MKPDHLTIFDSVYQIKIRTLPKEHGSIDFVKKVIEINDGSDFYRTLLHEVCHAFIRYYLPSVAVEDETLTEQMEHFFAQFLSQIYLSKFKSRKKNAKE